MNNETHLRDVIESELQRSVELGMQIEEALADAAGLIAEAEAAFIRLSQRGWSVPPPPRR